MDCSKFVFGHCDLGPTNIFVDRDQFTLIDWEMAGYVPLEWLRTKFAICGAMNVEWKDDEGAIKNDTAYRKLVVQHLGSMGFPQVTEAYSAAYEIRRELWEKNRGPSAS